MKDQSKYVMGVEELPNQKIYILYGRISEATLSIRISQISLSSRVTGLFLLPLSRIILPRSAVVIPYSKVMVSQPAGESTEFSAQQIKPTLHLTLCHREEKSCTGILFQCS